MPCQRTFQKNQIVIEPNKYRITGGDRVKKRITTIGKQTFNTIFTTSILLGAIMFTSIMFLVLVPERVSATTLYVGGGGPNNYSSIQDAINDANPGYTIYVYPKTYYEGLMITKSISLIGLEKFGAHPIIDNGGFFSDAVKVTNVNYFNITGFEIRNSTVFFTAGIRIDGILFIFSSNSTVYGNRIFNNKANGIQSSGSSNNNYINNIVFDNTDIGANSGFFFSQCPYYGNRIIGNIVYNNDDGIHLEDDNSADAITFWNNSITNNTVFNHKVDGIFIGLGRNNFVINNIAYNNGVGSINPSGGIRLASSNSNTVMGNTIHDNDHGIIVKQSFTNRPPTNNSIVKNLVYNNDNGIRLWRTENNTFIENSIFNNNYSVYMVAESHNNTFINCTLSNAFIDDFYLAGISDAITLNTTFNKDKVYYGDMRSNLTVKWFMHVKVKYSNGVPVNGAFVEVFDLLGTPKASRFTNPEGKTRWIVLTEYFERDVNGDTVGDRTYYTIHNATATDGVLVGYAIPEPFMDISKEVVIVLVIPLPDYIPWNTPPSQQKVSVGSTVPIFSRVRNVGNVNAINWTTIAFYNQSMPPFKTYTVPPLNVDAISNDYPATWTAPMIAGYYYVIIEVDYYNDIDEIDEANNTYEIEFNITDKPITTINLGSPQYGTTPRFVNSSTQFWFSVVDNSGTGYNTYYYIDNPPGIPYSGAFTVATEGPHTINYYSIDNLGGVEDTKVFEIIVDNTPPTTIINPGDPRYVSGNNWVTSATEFTISRIDGGLIPVGVNYTEYRVWNGGLWTPWSTYTTGFSLGSSEGFSYVEFYSIDWLGNKEPINNRTYIVDNTAPITTILVGTPIYIYVDTWVTSNTGFILDAADGGVVSVGVNYTEYRVWNGTWSPWSIYQGEFTFDPRDGIRYLEFHSVDLLGNVEPVINETYIVDDTPPETTITVSLPKYVSGNTWVTSDTEFIIDALDGGLIMVGLNYTDYRVWNNGSWTIWEEYSSGFTLDVDDGITYVEFYSVDLLGNNENIHNETYFVDNTPPVTTHILQLESDNTEARISLIPNDVGSGVNYTKYRVDSGDWATYSGTFTVNESGSHTIYFWSIDMLGNAETEKNFSVLIEEPGIVVPPGDGEEEVNWKPLIALIFTILLLLVGTYVSHKRPLKFIKNPKRKQAYTWMITVLPFVVAEIATGVISGLTGLLSVPPFLGPGMVVDLVILILGLLVFMLIYKKFGEK